MTTEEKLIELVGEVTTPFLAGIIGSHLADSGVEIPVLCEDCDHLRHTEDGTFCAITWTDVDNDDFCSFGRSREERNTR